MKPLENLGYYKNRHYSTYVDDIDKLVREGKTSEAISLLLNLIEVIEAENQAQQLGVAPWYYERLAIIYRKQKAFNEEIAILERFARQKHAPGVKPAKLLERLEKAKQQLSNEV